MSSVAQLPDRTAIDERFMRIAVRMAKRGLGTTAPNPSVGAVIVGDNGVILSRGWTQPGGRPHAEVVALEKAGETARGATLYVTLEPCSHFGKSPPCADAVVRGGIRRVVCALSDPNELVAGQGFARLREAGIEVVENVLSYDAHWVTLGHILRMREKRPFVQLKLALSRDGLIAPGRGQPVWVTGHAARERGHLVRAMAEAILIGSGTLKADNPRLDCRLPGLTGRSPRRVVMDSRLTMSPDSAMAITARTVAPVLVFHASPSRHRTIRELTEQGVELVELTRNEKCGGLDPREVLQALAERGVTRLMIEGGPQIARSFLEADLVDEMLLFEGQGELGAAGLLPFGDRGLAWLESLEAFEEVDRRRVGDDKMRIMRNLNRN